jgi:hypothetical protein
MAPARAVGPWRCQFWTTTGQFWPRKITVVGIQCKLIDNITRFSLSTFSECWSAPIIMVGNENGIRMWFFLPYVGFGTDAP